MGQTSSLNQSPSQASFCKNVGLPREHRLKHRQDFRVVYQQGKRCRGHYLTLWALSETPTTVPGSARIGISISQKVSKKAVVRNRLKRQIRAVLGELLPQIAPKWKLVISLKPEAIECEYEHFLRELKQLLLTAEVINGY